MSPDAPQRAIARVVELIKDGDEAERIMLFGSQVCGRPDSERGLAVLVVKESDQPEAGSAREVSRFLRPLPLDIVVATPQEIRERLAVGDYFIKGVPR